jgi:hypothetical protein
MPHHHPPGTERVPLALWAPPPGRPHLPPAQALADWLVRELTRPGQLVVDALCTDDAVVAAALAADRRAAGVTPGSTDDVVVVSPTSRRGLGLVSATKTPTRLGRGADLVVVRQPPRCGGHAAAGSLAVSAGAAMLRTGGYLAVVCRPLRRPASAHADAVTGTVAQAETAGLVYAQHVVALCCPVRDVAGTLDTPASAATGTGLCRVHTDVLLFRKPKEAA